jgi:hypothetical protein
MAKDDYIESVAFAIWKDKNYRQLANGLHWECTEDNRKKKVGELTLYTYTELYNIFQSAKEEKES